MQEIVGIGKRASKRLAPRSPQEVSFSDLEDEEQRDEIGKLEGKRRTSKKLTFEQARVRVAGQDSFAGKKTKHSSTFGNFKSIRGTAENENTSSSSNRADKVVTSPKRRLKRYEHFDYPKFPFTTPPVQLSSVAEGRQWLLSLLPPLFNNEIQTLEEILGESRRSSHSRLITLCEKVVRKMHSIPEFDQSFKTQEDEAWLNTKLRNPKNVELQQKETELRTLLHEYEEELDEWKSMKKQHELLDENTIQKEAETKAETLAKKICDAEKSIVKDISEKADPTENTPQMMIDTAIARLAYVNACLRGVKRSVSKGEAVSQKLAGLCHEKTFEAYDKINDPKELLKALTKVQPVEDGSLTSLM